MKLCIFNSSEDLRKKESGYLFTYPRTFLSGRNETVCLITHNTTVPTKVLVDLKIKDNHYLTSNTLEAGIVFYLI